MTSETTPRGAAIPSIVEILNPLVRCLLRIGVPMGPNALLTVLGRSSGQPRTFPIAVLEAAGRTYVFSAFGEVNWVHNLRASGAATLTRGRREQAVVGVELSPAEAAPILEAGLSATMKVKMFGPMIAGWYGVTPASTSADYAESARKHPAFELRPAAPRPGR